MLTDKRRAEIDDWLTDFACTTPEVLPDWLKTIIELRAEVDRLRGVIVIGSDRLTGAEAEIDRLRAANEKLGAEAQDVQFRNEVDRQHISSASWLQRARDHVQIEKLEARLAAAEAVCAVWGLEQDRCPTGSVSYPALQDAFHAWTVLCRQQDAREGGQEPAQQDNAPETSHRRGQGASGA